MALGFVLCAALVTWDDYKRAAEIEQIKLNGKYRVQKWEA